MKVGAGSDPGPKTGIRISELSDLGQHFFNGEYFFRKIIICQIFPAFSKKNLIFFHVSTHWFKQVARI
jgi:hypothetical protein